MRALRGRIPLGRQLVHEVLTARFFQPLKEGRAADITTNIREKPEDEEKPVSARIHLDAWKRDLARKDGLGGVEVTDSAAPIVRHSRIHGGAAAGLWFRAAGGGLVEGNEIWGNG